MRTIPGSPCHECCPEEWRKTPDITGSYELDGVIARNNNGDIASRLAMYCKGQGEQVYGPLTAYNGYHNYSGDS